MIVSDIIFSINEDNIYLSEEEIFENTIDKFSDIRLGKQDNNKDMNINDYHRVNAIFKIQRIYLLEDKQYIDLENNLESYIICRILSKNINIYKHYSKIYIKGFIKVNKSEYIFYGDFIE